MMIVRVILAVTATIDLLFQVRIRQHSTPRKDHHFDSALNSALSIRARTVRSAILLLLHRRRKQDRRAHRGRFILVRLPSILRQVQTAPLLRRFLSGRRARICWSTSKSATQADVSQDLFCLEFTSESERAPGTELAARSIPQ